MESESSGSKLLHLFCQRISSIADGSNPNQWPPEQLAREFRRFFHLPSPIPDPSGERICGALGISSLQGIPMPENMRACHMAVNGRLEIYHTEGDWAGGIAFSVLHELREYFGSILPHLNPAYIPPQKLCRQANQFAACVLMERNLFRQKALGTGFNVPHLREFFGASYASILIRMTEVFQDELPMACAVYENTALETFFKQRPPLTDLKKLPKRRDEFQRMDHYRATVSTCTSYLRSLDISHGEFQRIAPSRGTLMEENPWATFAVTKVGGYGIRYIYKNVPSDPEGSEEQWMNPVTDVHLVRYYGVLAKVLLVAIPLAYRFSVDPFFKPLQDADFKKIRQSMWFQLEES